MPNDNIKVGGIEMEGSIDWSGAEKGTKSYGDLLAAVNKNAGYTEKGLIQLEQAGKKAGDSLGQASVATQALSAALGYLGANSIAGIVNKISSLVRESVNLAVSLEGVHARAQALFGKGLPQLTEQLNKLAQQAGRSSSNLLDMATSFGLVLDNFGLSQKKTQDLSVELSKLAVNIGKAFPDRSDAQIGDALQMGIAGATRGLVQYGIKITDKILQDKLDTEGVKKKVAQLSEEQLAYLRIQVILDQSNKLQQAAAASAGSYGDNLKKTKDILQDIGEMFGTTLLPILNYVIRTFNDIITNVQTANAEIIRFLTLGHAGLTDYRGPGYKQVSDADIAKLKWHGPSGSPPQSLGSALKEIGGNGSSGGGESAAEKIAKAEKDILDAIDGQAKANLDNLKTKRDELQLREKLGVLTKEEASELETINRRVAFHKDAVDDATKAWQDQMEAVQKVEDKIKDINDRIIEEHQRLKDELANIDKEAAKNKAEEVAKLLKEKQDIEAKANGISGVLSGDDSKRLGEINSILGSADAQSLAEGQKQSQLNPLQLIDYQAEQQKKAAAEKSNARQEELQQELQAERTKLFEVQNDEQRKKQAVISALNDRFTATQANFKLVEDATEAHIAKQVEQYNRLRGAITGSVATPPRGFASGGMVYGPGGPTDDRIPALLSNGEFVVRAAAVSAYRPLLDAINSLSLPRFAEGGLVTHSSVNNAKTVNYHAHYHGASARIMGRPDIQRWEIRRSLR